MAHPWEGLLLNRFLSSDRDGQEKEYYPPYNLLLYTHFPPAENFIVAPVTHPLSNRESIDFTIEYVIEMDNRPIFVLEVKPPRSLNNSSSRSDADWQMRRRLRDIIDECPLDTLHGISAFGTFVAVYSADKTSRLIQPPAITDNVNFIVDTSPKERWIENHILDRECASKIDALFDHIKTQCRLLR